MALFNIGKKKEAEAPACCGESGQETACCCGTGTAAAEGCCCGEPAEGICCVKVLGAGCKNCHELLGHVKAVVAELGLTLDVEFITDMEKIMAYGVMTLPALVVNEQVASVGKVLKKDDVRKILSGYLA